jgi:hypothetical protein
MKVFLSWSGPMSYQIASVLSNWLPLVIQAVEPFVSTKDISKGTRWGDVLAKQLDETAYGIVCVTKYNVSAPWLHFEAGAISRAVKKSKSRLASKAGEQPNVSPFLLDVRDSELSEPLAQFEATEANKDDVFRLVLSINHRLEHHPLSEELLGKVFDRWWPDLEAELKKIREMHEDTYTGSKWLYNAEELAELETSLDCKAIWVITPQPHKDSQCDRVRDVLLKNIERGVTYTFIIPDTGELAADTRELKTIFENAPVKLNIRKVPLEQFSSLAVTHYLIMNPDPHDRYKRQVFLELPIDLPGQWIKVGDHPSTGVTERFRKWALFAWTLVRKEDVSDVLRVDINEAENRKPSLVGSVSSCSYTPSDPATGQTVDVTLTQPQLSNGHEHITPKELFDKLKNSPSVNGKVQTIKSLGEEAFSHDNTVYVLKEDAHFSISAKTLEIATALAHKALPRV